MYDVDKPLYDQTSYWGRFKQMYYLCGPGSWNTLFVSKQEIQSCVDFVQKYRNLPIERKEAVLPQNILWAKHVKDATCHPDTNSPIPFPFRMSAHVPMNTLLLVGMLSARTRGHHVIAQTCNQTFNAFQFFFNRNHSNKVSNGTLALATVAAVGGATGAVFLMDKWIEKLRSRGSRHFAFAQLLLPLVCAASAKPFQIAIMRSDELFHGVKVYDETQETCFGSSAIAGLTAIGLTITTRITYLLQPMLLPPLLMQGMKKVKPLKRMPMLLQAINVSFICACSAIATPMCIALFEQRSSLDVSSLEPELQDKVRSHYDGCSVAEERYRVYFNKGL